MYFENLEQEGEVGSEFYFDEITTDKITIYQRESVNLPKSLRFWAFAVDSSAAYWAWGLFIPRKVGLIVMCANKGEAEEYENRLY